MIKSWFMRKRRVRVRAFGRLGAPIFALLLAVVTASAAHAVANYVYHDPTGTSDNPAGHNYRRGSVVNSSTIYDNDAATIKVKIEYDGWINTSKIAYTTNGVNATVSDNQTALGWIANGTWDGTGTPQVWGSNSVIPLQATNTVVKYIIWANHDAGDWIYANGGNDGFHNEQSEATQFSYTVVDDDSATPVISAYTGVDTFRNCGFFVTTTATDTGAGLSASRSKVYFSWTANLTDSFTSVAATDLGGGVYSYTCPNNVASNEFTGKIGKKIYWFAYVADADNDGSQGDADSKTAIASGNAVILPLANDLVINELGRSGGSSLTGAAAPGDYIEIYNRSGYSICIDSMTIQTDVSFFPPKDGTNSIANGDYYFLEDFETVTAAASDSLITRLILESSDTVRLMFGDYSIDSTQIFSTDLSNEYAASVVQVSQERAVQSGYGLTQTNWQPAARILAGNSQGKDTYFAGTPKAANTDYSTIPVYFSEIYDTTNAANNYYLELYNAGTDSYVLYKWSIYVGSATPSLQFTGFSNASVIRPSSYFLIEEQEVATTVTADLIDPSGVSFRSTDLKAFTIYGGLSNSYTLVDQAGAADDWKVTTLGVAIEKDASNLSADGTVAGNWGNSTGSIGSVTGTPRAANTFTANAIPAVYLANIKTPTIFDKLYAGKQFKISAVYTDTDGAADLQRFDLRIGNGTDTIAMYAYRPAAGAAASFDAGAAYVTAATVDSSFSGNNVTCTWNITLDWDFVEASTYKIGVRGADDSPETSAWTDSTLSWTYENDLILSGTLANNQGLTDGGYTTKINTSTTWSGLTVYYQGSTSVSPEDGDFDIQLAGQPGNTTQAAGAVLSQAKTTRATDGVDYCTVTVISIPAGGSFVDATPFGMTFTVDATAPVITVNRDSYTIKSTSGAMYGKKFDVDFTDATTNIMKAYATVGTADTEQVLANLTSPYTTDWRIDSLVYNALAAGHNSVRITAVDSAGNFSNANIYISKEPITVNTDTGDWRSDELLDTRQVTRFRVTWDDTSLYFSYGGAAGNLGDADLFVYILPDTAAGGSSTTINWGSYGTHTLPFAAKYAMCMDNATLSATNAEFQSAAGGTFSNTANYDNIELSNGSGVVECRIGWNRLGGKPASSLKIVAIHQWETARNVYNSLPVTNPAPNDASGITLTDYYDWSNLSDTTPPIRARMDTVLFSGPGSTDVAASFNMTLGALNHLGETLAGYNSSFNLTISAGTLSTTSTTLTGGDVTLSNSITGTSGSRTMTATALNNSAVTATNAVTVNLLDSPTYVINTAQAQWLKSNPTLDVDFTDNTDLDDISYQVDAYTGAWTAITSDGSSVTGQNIAGATFTDNFMITTADWNALADGQHTIYFKATDDGGKETGTGGILAVGLLLFKDVTAPTLTVNRDSHTIKEDGYTYGKLFNVDFNDVTGYVKEAWIERVNGTTVSDTWFIISNNTSGAYTTNWQVGDTFTAAMTNNAINICKVRARDTAGNVSTAGTIYVKKEILSSVDGDTSDWQTDELIDQRKGNELRVAWDDTCLYLSYGGPDGSAYEVGGAGADFFFYIQTSNATTADSTYTPIDWATYGDVHKLPFGANYCVTIEGDYTAGEEDNMILEFQKATAGSWGGNLQVDSQAYIGRHSSNNRLNEYRVSWSHLGGMPDSMLLIFYHEYENASNIYNALPPGNPAGGAAAVVFTDYYYIPIIKDTVSPMTTQRISNSPGRRRVDGDTADWNWQNWPAADDTSLIKDSEFVWRAAINDERTDFADVSDLNFDLRALRIAADTDNLYVLTVLQDLVDPNLIMQAISIDTDLVTNSGQQEIGGTSRTRTVDTAMWEMCFLTNTSLTGWWNTNFSNLQTDGSSYISGPNDVIELSIPWRRLYKSSAGGDSLPRRVRFTFITGRKDATSTYDFMREAAWDATTRSRAVDGVDLAARKTAGLFDNEVLGTDTELGYYFEVDFDTTGWIIANKLDPISYPSVCTTARPFNVTLEASDFNGNPMGNNTTLGTVTFAHTGAGSLTIESDSTGWSGGQRRFSLMYTNDETITITATEAKFGKTGGFTLQCVRDTSGPNAWYVNDTVYNANDSFTAAVGNDANRGLSPQAPKLTLAAVLPWVTSGDTIYLDGGTFDRSTELTIDDGGLIIQGVDSGKTVIRFTTSDAVKISGVDTVTIQDLQIQKPTRGIWISSGDSCVIRRVRIDTATEYLVLLDGGSDSNLIQDCHFRKSSQDAALLTAGSDRNTLLRNVIEQAAWHGLSLSSSADTNYLIMNIAQDNSRHGISIDASDFAALTENRSRRNAMSGIMLSGTSFRATATSDTAEYNDHQGIQLSAGGFHTVQYAFAHNNGHAGVHIDTASTDNAVLSVRGDSNGVDGVRITSGTNNAIRHSRFWLNRGSGFRIYSGSTGSVFAGNTCESNAQYAANVGEATVILTKNNLMKDTGTNALNAGAAGINAARNWWGAKDSATVKSLISNFDATTYTPYRLGEADTRPGADTVAPNPAVGLAVTPEGLTTMTVSWTAVTTDEESTSAAFALTGYRIYHAKSNDTTYWLPRGAVLSGTTSFTDSNLVSNDVYWWRVTAYDANSPTNESAFGDSFSARVGYAQVVIGEIGVGYTADEDSDFIEIYIADDNTGGQGTNLQDWKFYTTTAGSNRTLRKRTGSLSVRTGDFVTLFFNSVRNTADSTATSAIDSHAFIYTDSSNSVLTSGQGLIEIEAPPAGLVRDAVVYSDQATLDAVRIAPRLQILVDSGLWSPDNTAANTAPNTGLDVRGQSIRRANSMGDTNVKADWGRDTQSPGTFRVATLEAITDSTTPYMSVPFNIRLGARDIRGDSVTGARNKPAISISAGSISPAVARFDTGHAMRLDASETTVRVTITQTYDTQTITFAEGGVSCTVAVVIRAPLDSFVLTAPPVPNKVIRNDSFGLRVRASNIFGGTVSFFTGTVNLSISNGTIIPSSLTFTTADAGDTTILAQVSGIGQCSITASSSNKTGTTVVIPVHDTRLVISEILFNDEDRPGGGNIDRDEYIEIYNRGTASKSLTNHTLRIRPLVASADQTYTFPSLTVPAGKFVVVHFNKLGTDDLNFNDTDGAAHLFSQNANPALTDPEDVMPHSAGSNPNSATLYDSTTQDSRTVIDFVGIDAGATSNTNLHDTDANQAGLWVKYATLNFPTTAANNIGRSIYRLNEVSDSDGTTTNEWSTIASDGSTDSYRYTDGYSNKQNTWPSGTIVISCSTTSSPLLGDTIAAGDTIYIWLSATTDGDAATANTTNVFVYSDTDPTGIVVTLKETGNNTKLFYGEAFAAATPLESNDGMRRIVTQPGDSVTVQWVGSLTVKRSTTSTGTIHHFRVTPSATTINQGDALTLTVTAQDAGNWTVTSFTGTCTIALTDSRTYPDTFKFIAAGNGETSISVIVGASAGTITCTVTSAGGITGTTVITVIADTDVLINEVMANVGAIDWTGNGGTTEADEWVELYNKGTTAFSIAGYKLRPSGSASSITLVGSIPPKGWVTVYRGTSGTGKSYHYDSSGYPTDTNTGLTGNFSTELVDAGGTVELLDPLNTVAAAVTYIALANDSSYGRAPDGTNAWYTFKRPTPGLNGTPSPDNLFSPNARFRFDAPETAAFNTAFTLRVALTSYNGDTITGFLDTATIRSESSGTLTPTSLSFTNGICTASVTYTGGSDYETSILAVFTYGAISGRDTVGLRVVTVSVSQETTQVNVEQAIANGVDTSMVQVIAMTAAGAPLAGMTVTISSSKGALDTITPASATTNSAGYCSFTVVSRDTGPSKITAVVDGQTAFDSPVIYWLDPAESGVNTSFGTKTTLLTLDDDSHFILFPQWRRDGKAMAWLAKTAAVDTWAIYTAFDDGAHGDGAANDGTFTTYRITDTTHNVFLGSKIAFADILKADGTRCAAGEAGDGVQDVIYSAYNGANRKDLFVVRSGGQDSVTAKAALVCLTANEGTWTMPSMVSDDTIYAIFGGSIYRLHGKGVAPYSVGGGTDKILDAGTIADFMINGKNFAVVDIALYDSNVMGVTMILNKTGDSNRNKRSEILLINGVETAGYRQWTSVGGSCKLVTRTDSGVAWNLSWDTGGRALSWAREITGTFNWLLLWNRPFAPEQAYTTSDFDVEATYVSDTWYTPNRPVSLINNKGGMNDQSACFSMGSTARVAYASYDTRTGQVKLNVADIDGVTVVDQDGGLLFQDGRLTAVIDEGDNLSGSVEIKVQRPTAAPANPTPESIALTGNAREFFPNGKTFDDSITAILYYDAADLTAANVTNGTAEEYTLRVYWYNPTTSIWEDYNAIVDPTDRNGALGSLTFQTNHFSIYGVGFAPQHPNRPDLVAPIQGSTLATRSPTFSWMHNDPQSRPQIGFQIEIATDSNFTAVVVAEERSTSDTTVTLNTLLPVGESTLYWRVRTGAIASAYGAWSLGDSVFLTSIRVPSAPGLVSPSNGIETRTGRPVFSWSHSDPDGDTQSRAQIEIATDSAFVAPVVSNTLETSAQSLHIDATLADGLYWWRVRTADANGFGNWSVVRGITVNTLPVAPAIVSAPAAITHPTPSFTWTHSDPDGRPQTAFRIILSADSAFATTILDFIVDTSAASATLNGDRALAVRGTSTIHYRLATAAAGRAFGPATQSSFAATLNPPAAPALLFPADNTGTTAASITFAWAHVDAEGDTQTGYALRIGRDTSFATPLYIEELPGAITSRTLALSLTGGVYYWQAATRDAVDRGAWSAVRRFTWTGETGPMQPMLGSPATGALTQTPLPTFQWTHRDRNNAAQSGALLEIALAPSFSPVWRSRAVAGATQTATLDASDSLYQPGETTVYWRVRTASFGSDYGAPSAESSFTLRASVPSAPVLLTPVDSFSTRVREAEFFWRGVSELDSLPQTAFEFQIAPTLGFVSPATLSGMDDPSIVVSLSAGTSYWRVRTATLMGWSPWSVGRPITVDTRPYAPTPLEPVAGATLSSPRPLFRWAHHDPASEVQRTALIEIATDSTFAAILRSTSIETSSASWRPRESESIPLEGNHTIYWRVRTSNAGADYGAASGETAFNVALNRPAAPTASTPADTARDIRPLFTWTHNDPDADPEIGVRIQVARDSAFASPVVDATWETAVANHRFASSLASGNWAWRIMTRDEVGWSPWSTARAFAIDTFPLWRILRITSGRSIPTGETRSIGLELVTETGLPIPWPSSASVTIGSWSFYGVDFVSETSIGRIGVRFDTPGAWPITVREDAQAGRDTLTVIARPSAPASSDTYAFLFGRHGAGQRVIEDDTRITVILRTLVSDTRYALRLSTTMDTLLIADTVPTSVDSGLVFWSNLPVTLQGGERIVARIFRDTALVAYERAIVLARPTRALLFRESETGAGVIVDVPAGACDTPLFISVSRAVGDSVHRAAGDNARRNGRKYVEGSVVDVTATDIDGRVITLFSGNLTLRIPAAAANGLRIAYLKDGAWTEIEGTTWDSVTQQATAPTDHLTVWGLTVATLAGANVNNVRIYPNPWRSDGPTGSLASSNAAYGVKFDQMPAGQVRIRVFTIAGELVLDGTLDPSSLGASSANGHLQVTDVGGATGQITRWDLKNQHGNDVASGLYLIVLEGPGGRATRRFAIAR
jgi:hypothetical protein